MAGRLHELLVEALIGLAAERGVVGEHEQRRRDGRHHHSGMKLAAQLDRPPGEHSHPVLQAQRVALDHHLVLANGQEQRQRQRQHPDRAVVDEDHGVALADDVDLAARLRRQGEDALRLLERRALRRLAGVVKEAPHEVLGLGRPALRRGELPELEQRSQARREPVRPRQRLRGAGEILRGERRHAGLQELPGLLPRIELAGPWALVGAGLALALGQGGARAQAQAQAQAQDQGQRGQGQARYGDSIR